MIDKMIRVKFVRSRLTYTTQAWNSSEKDLAKIQVVWNSMVRKMIRGGSCRTNGKFYAPRANALRQQSKRECTRVVDNT